MNGRRYDAATGVPADSVRSTHIPTRGAPRRAMSDIIPARRATQKPAAVQETTTVAHISDTPKQRTHTPAKNIHSSTQRSHTLKRAPLKKPEVQHAGEVKRQRAIVAKSPHITKFGPKTRVERKRTPVTSVAPSEIQEHPTTQKIAQKKQIAREEEALRKVSISSRAVKEQLIKEQLDKVDAKPNLKEHVQPKKRGKKARLTSILATTASLFLLAGYFTYLNIPGLSIRVAAVQAGVNASLPDYRPDGYAFSGPVDFSQGEVALNFSANGGPQSYSITQTASDWDSQAVLDNYILEQSEGDYSIHSTKGLTVYTYNNKAVWVNRGILHEVNYDNAPLSINQIERIAASM